MSSYTVLRRSTLSIVTPVDAAFDAVVFYPIFLSSPIVDADPYIIKLRTVSSLIPFNSLLCYSQMAFDRMHHIRSILQLRTMSGIPKHRPNIIPSCGRCERYSLVTFMFSFKFFLALAWPMKACIIFLQ